MRRKVFDSTLFSRAVLVEPPNTCEAYSIQDNLTEIGGNTFPYNMNGVYGGRRKGGSGRRGLYRTLFRWLPAKSGQGFHKLDMVMMF